MVIESVCMKTDGQVMNETIPMPENALVVNNGLFAAGNDTVDFTVIQKWTVDDAGLAIRADGEDSCIVKGGVEFGDSENVEGECVAGIAAVTIVVYLDEEFEPDQCEACNVEDLEEMGGEYEFCAYRVEIPCEPVAVECGEPSAAPSGSYYPSSAPSEAPTDTFKPSSSPTESPSASPTKAPTAKPTESPTAGPTASPSATPTSNPTDAPTAQPTASPSASPTSNPTDAPTAAPSASSYPSSVPSLGPSFSSYPSSSPSDAPTEGIDQVFPPPTVAPTKCPPSDPVLISQEGETMYPSPPVKITKQNTTHVAFKVENTFDGKVSSIFTQYHAGKFGSTECLEEENVDENSFIEFEFVAQCMVNTKLSVVQIWVTDCSDDDGTPSFLDESDNAEIPECCHPGEKQCKTVEYTFKLPCVSPCPEDEVTTLPIADKAPDGAKEAPNRPAKEASGGHRNLTATAKNGKEDAADQHFCVVEDYPCGPSNDMVYACHYSARDGYKTFCVPEPDSDALRYYPKDYCGPCVGGYARDS